MLCTFDSLESIILLLHSPNTQQQFFKIWQRKHLHQQSDDDKAEWHEHSSAWLSISPVSNGHFGVSHRKWKPTPIYFAKNFFLREFEVAFDFNVHTGRWKHSCRMSCDIALLDSSGSCLRWHRLPRFPRMHSNNKRYLQTDEGSKIVFRLIHEKYLNILPSHYVARVTRSYFKFVSSTSSTFYCRYVIIRCLYQQNWCSRL